MKKKIQIWPGIKGTVRKATIANHKKMHSIPPCLHKPKTCHLKAQYIFGGLLLRDFQATVLTVNCKYIIKEIVILF